MLFVLREEKTMLRGSLALVPFTLGLVGAACAPMQPRPARSEEPCRDVVQMPCLSGAECVDGEDGRCKICKCRPPPGFEPYPAASVTIDDTPRSRVESPALAR
ncbi:MAG: hypothetical protein U0414_35110 [Polyangiaceae bacterium]